MNDPVGEFLAAVRAALGYAPDRDRFTVGKRIRFPTCDRRGDAAGSCIMFDDMRGGTACDHRSGARMTWQAKREPLTAEQRREYAQRIEAEKRRREAKRASEYAQAAQRNAATWRQCVPIAAGDPVTLYLAHRGLSDALAAPPRCLRLHPALEYFDADGAKVGSFPAMVAPLAVIGTRSILALHRTYLTADGRKASVAQAKKLSRTAGPLDGACIPLYRAEGEAIGIAEGIETAIAAHLASGLPTVAAYSAAMLAAWRWPAHVRRVVIFADHDPAGIEAAAKLAQRVRDAGLRCDTLTPTDDGADWADVWAARECAA
jgi:phage/plasmid primase-like uncharacterized protein